MDKILIVQLNSFRTSLFCINKVPTPTSWGLTGFIKVTDKTSLNWSYPDPYCFTTGKLEIIK